MALRVTQQSVDVLSEASGGKLMVTQFYIEVLGEPGDAPVVSQAMSLSHSATETLIPGSIEVNASSTLAFSQSAEQNLNIPANAANALAFVQDVLLFGDKRVSAENTLALTDLGNLPQISVSASNDLSILTDSGASSGVAAASASSVLSFQESVTSGVIYVNVSHTMSLTHSPYAGQNISASASNTIALTHDDTPGIYFGSASSILSFVQEAFGDNNGASIRSVVQELGITDTATGVVTDFGRQITHPVTFLQSVTVGGPKSVNVTDVLSLANIPTQHQGVANISVSHFLDLQQSAGQVFFVTADTPMTLTHAAFRRFFASHSLALTETVSVNVAKPMTHSLGLIDLASRVLVVNRTFTDNLGLNSSVAAFITNSGILCQYAPFIGDGPGTAIPATMPTLGSAKLTLTHPFVSPTRTVILRNPQFGNADRLSFDRINRETRGGTLIMFADPTWPKQQTMNITLVALSRQQKEDLLDFLNASIGQDIGLLDHENRLWKGIMLTPDAAINNDSRDGHTVTLEFEGALQ